MGLIFVIVAMVGLFVNDNNLYRNLAFQNLTTNFPWIEIGGFLMGWGFVPSLRRMRVKDTLPLLFGLTQTGVALVAVYYIARVVLNIGSQVTVLPPNDIFVFNVSVVSLVSDIGVTILSAASAIFLAMLIRLMRDQLRNNLSS